MLVEEGRESGEVGCEEQAVKGGSFVNRGFFGGGMGWWWRQGEKGGG